MARRRPGDAPDMSAKRPTANILALHGFTGVGADFAPFAEMCGNTWHCPNLPGHGPNPSLDCTPEATLRFVEAQRVANNQQPANNNQQPTTANVLLGYSMGARAALLHVCKHPSAWDALILISPNPGIEDNSERAERRAVDEKLAQRIEKEGIAAFIDFWQSTPMIRSQKNIRSDWRQTMQAIRQLHTVEGLATSLRQFGQGHCSNLWPELHKLTMPVLLITGAEDIKYTAIARRMAEILPTLSRHNHAKPDFHSPLSTHVLIDDVSHMPHLEDPEICADSIGEFINELG